MTETPGSGPVWHGEPLVSRTAEPDWAAMANRHEHEVRRRKQIRVAAAGVAGVVAIAGIMATVIQLSGSGHRSATASAASATGRASATTAGGLDGSTSVTVDGGGSPSASAPGGSTAPGAQAPAGPSAAGQTAAASSPGGAGPAAPGGRSTTPAGGPAPQQTTSAPSPGGNPAPPPPQKPPAPTPTANNPYTPVEACGGGGYFVIDSHALSGATVYLLYNNGNGNNCVVTMVTHPSGSVPMNATLAVQGGGSGSNPGSFTDYAGPVVEHAPAACVEWGGSYQGSSWTSGWSHCSR